MVPRLRELAPVVRVSQEAGFTQPRDHSLSLAQPCIQHNLERFKDMDRTTEVKKIHSIMKRVSNISILKNPSSITECHGGLIMIADY